MELFAFLEPLRDRGFTVDFVPRVAGVRGSLEKEEGLAELEPVHRKRVEGLGFAWEQLWRAEQVHGNDLAEVGSEKGEGGLISGVDGLMTNDREALLGIYVADCGLIWLADQETRAISLLHSGRKGTEGGILTNAVAEMGNRFGTRPENLIGVLGPCIRPPHYEVDIASQIAEQAEQSGLGEFHDCGICTGAEVSHYYSYRMEKGLTGRMLGLLASRSAS